MSAQACIVGKARLLALLHLHGSPILSGSKEVLLFYMRKLCCYIGQ